MEENMIIDCDKLINEKNNNQKKIYEKHKEVRILEQRNKIISKQLYKVCEHTWVRDFIDMGPYSSIEYVCSKCNLYK